MPDEVKWVQLVNGATTVAAQRSGHVRLVLTGSQAHGLEPERFVEGVPHLSTHFSGMDESRLHEGGGSGIGLTIAKHLVEAHGGRLWAESAGSGQGSTFTFTLPSAA